MLGEIPLEVSPLLAHSAAILESLPVGTLSACPEARPSGAGKLSLDRFGEGEYLTSKTASAVPPRKNRAPGCRQGYDVTADRPPLATSASPDTAASHTY